MSETPCKLTIEFYDRSLIVEAPDLITIRDVMRELAKAPDSERAILPDNCKTTAVFGDCFKVKVDGETVADGYDATLAPGWKSGPSLRAQRRQQVEAVLERSADDRLGHDDDEPPPVTDFSGKDPIDFPPPTKWTAHEVALVPMSEFTPHPVPAIPKACDHPNCDCTYWLSIYSCGRESFVTRCRARDIMVLQETGEPE
jgi:hypothetical protein